MSKNEEKKMGKIIDKKAPFYLPLTYVKIKF